MTDPEIPRPDNDLGDDVQKAADGPILLAVPENSALHDAMRSLETSQRILRQSMPNYSAKVWRMILPTFPDFSALVRPVMPDYSRLESVRRDIMRSFEANERVIRQATQGYSAMFERLRRQVIPDSIVAAQRAWAAALREQARTSRLPQNLRVLSGITSDDVIDFTFDHGISLYLVPRPEIAQRMLAAGDPAKVRRILGDSRVEILADCRAVLEQCDQPSTLTWRKLALQALDSMERDSYGPAQSQAANLLDTIRNFGLKKPLESATRRRKNESDSDLRARWSTLSAWEQYVVVVLSTAFTRYDPKKGDVIPYSFNRHATTHAAGSRQYSRRSAVQGLMAVTSALGFLNGLS